MQRLREAAEKAKRELDGLSATEVSLPFITADAEGPKHLNIRLTKAKFESLVEHLVQKTLGPCKTCLKDSGVKKEELTEVLLVGGMTRMPKVRTYTYLLMNKLVVILSPSSLGSDGGGGILREEAIERS